MGAKMAEMQETLRKITGYVGVIGRFLYILLVSNSGWRTVFAREPGTNPEDYYTEMCIKAGVRKMMNRSSEDAEEFFNALCEFLVSTRRFAFPVTSISPQALEE